MLSKASGQDQGIKISQVGVNVLYAADYQLVFNSAWPSLAIAFDTTVDVPANANLTIPHGLKIYPLTMAWALSGGVNLGRIFTASENFESVPQSSINMNFDNVNVYLTGDPTNEYQVNVKCYNLDISESADYTLPKPPVIASKYDPVYGMRVVKYGKSIGSTDLRDYILNTQAQSPAVLSVVSVLPPNNVPDPTTGQIASYKNPVGYTPWVLAFVGFQTDGTNLYTGLAPGFQQTGFRFDLGPTSTIQANISDPVASLVVLRDPLVIPKSIMVTYG